MINHVCIQSVVGVTEENLNEWCNLPVKVFRGFIETDFALHLAPSVSTGTEITESEKYGNDTSTENFTGEPMGITPHSGLMKFQR